MSKSVVRKLSVLFLIFIFVVAVTSFVLAQEGEVVIEPDAPVRIGVAAGLSGEGIAPLGIDIVRGVELAVVDRPVVTVGDAEFAVEIDPQDEGCNAEGGQTVANRFTADESVVAVVGHMCSSSCVAGAPIYDAAGYTTISPSCTAPDLTFRGFTSFNRAVPPDSTQGLLAAQFIFNELGVTKIATIHDGSLYGEGLVNVVSVSFEELGGEVVAADAVNVGDTDFRSLLEDFAAEEPELIYFGGFNAEAARLIQQRADAGMEDVLFMGADGIWGPEVIELAGEAAEGIYASKPIPAEATGEQLDAQDAFLEKYVETYGEEPPAPFHMNAYDATNILLDAIEATAEVDADGNLVVDRAALAEYVRSIADFPGLTGVLTADGTGETAVYPAIGFDQVQMVDGNLEFVRLMEISAVPEEE